MKSNRPALFSLCITATDKRTISHHSHRLALASEQDSRPHWSATYADSPFIRQSLQPLPEFRDSYTMIDSWVAGNSAAGVGIGIREDNPLITKDSSRFLPHIILD